MIAGIEFDGTIDVGNLLTSFTILVSLAALLFSLSKDRRTRERELSDRVRAAAAKTLGKLERWQQLSARFYDDVHPVFVDVSQKLHSQLDAEQARDLLWSELTAARTTSEQRIVDEEIESAYVELYPYHPSVQHRFSETMSSLKRVDASVYFEFMKQTQEEVLRYGGAKKDYIPAMLGNDLRLASARAEQQLITKLEQTIRPIRDFLVAIVSLSDDDIVSRARLPSDSPAAHGV
jgi:hypothetical protein